MFPRPLALVAAMAALAAAPRPSAATDVIGNVNTNTQWRLANSPYRLVGDVTVASQATLTIEPGVVVEAQTTDQAGGGQSQSKVELTVQGTLVANGTASQRIVFKGASQGRDTWFGIYLDVGAKASSLTNVQIGDATYGIWTRSTARHTLSDVLVQRCTTGVLSQTTAGLAMERAEITAFASQGVRIEDDGAGGAAASLSQCFVHSADTASVGISVANRVDASVSRSRVMMTGTGIKADAGASLACRSNVLAGNFSAGMVLNQIGTKAFTILFNTVDSNYLGGTGTGIGVEAVSSAPSFVVRNNLVTSHPIGIRVQGSTAPSNDHNDVWSAPSRGWTTYSGPGTMGPSTLSINPLYQAPFGTAAGGATWVSVDQSQSLSPSRYGTATATYEQPGAMFLRVRVSSMSAGNGGSDTLTVSDRAGSTVSYWSGSLGAVTSDAIAGNYAYVSMYRYYYSAYATLAGYDYIPVTAANYRLAQSSPVIDAGNDTGLAGETDVDGTARPYDGDVNGTATSDLGAYEWHENIAPTAVAGADRVVKPGTAVPFDSAGSYDPDGRIVQWDWDFGDGSAHASTATATHTYASAGTYTVQLTVTDDLGATGTDTATVDVRDNLPPVADAGPDQLGAGVGQTLTFNGSASHDTDGNIISYDWDFGDATPHGNNVTVTHAYARTGVFTVTLLVTDDRGSTGTDTASVVVGGAQNQRPVADAGPVRTVMLGQAVQLSAGGSHDPDGNIVSYAWNLGDGATDSGLDVSHTYAAIGTYAVTLVVTDNAGLTGTDTTSVIVNAVPNAAPVARAGGPYSGLAGTPIAFDGSASADSDGNIVSWRWDFGDGSNPGTLQKPTHTYAAAGPFLVRLTVIDDDGASADDTALVNVTAPANMPPVADAGGPYAALVGQALLFDGSRSADSDGSIVAYRWDFGDGATDAGRQVTHTYGAAGAYLVRLTVTDNKGATGTDAKLASVTVPGNRPPVARAGGPYSGQTGQVILFNGSGSSDPDGSVAAWHWDFGDGRTGDGESVQHTFDAAGSYLVRLTVTDNAGATDDDSVLATISAPGNQPPVARAGGNRTARVGESIAFDATASADPDGSVASYLWDFGDGTGAATARASHAWNTAGSYLVRLTVTDNRGAIGQDIALVSVGAAGNKAPVADAGPDVNGNAGSSVAFNASGSSDPDGSIVAYQWDFGDGATAAGLSALHTYQAGGVYTVTLTVIDNGGAHASDTLKARVNALPMCNAGGDRMTTVGVELTLAGGGTDTDGSIVTWRWTFGDGQTGDGETVAHTWTEVGSYEVTLEVTDNAGGRASDTITVIVDAASTPAGPEQNGCGCAANAAPSLLAALPMLAAVRRRRARA